MFRATLLTTVAALFYSVAAVDVTVNATEDTKLYDAATQLDRFKSLSNASDWFYDFTKNPFFNYAPGGVTNMNAATFPAAKGLGLTIATLTLGPCSMLPPHFHPRATNFVVAVSGTTTTYMFQENGAHTIIETLNPFQSTIFPQGSLHMMVNNGCSNSTLISALNSDDSGTLNIGELLRNSANGGAGFPADLVNAAWGGINVANNVTASAIPAPGTGANYGTDACMQKCGISRPASLSSTTTSHATTSATSTTFAHN